MSRKPSPALAVSTVAAVRCTRRHRFWYEQSLHRDRLGHPRQLTRSATTAAVSEPTDLPVPGTA